MTNHKTIEISREGPVINLWLNRPEVHNAFIPDMIEEIYSALSILSRDTNIRLLVIRGRGKSFCSGADIHWMSNLLHLDYEQHMTESLALSECLQTIYTFPVPVISVVHGSVIGGGLGIMAASDFIVCSENTQFAFSEVTIGLVPAIISPFVIRRTGEAKAKELMLLGNRFDSVTAEKYGLVSQIADSSSLETTLQTLSERILRNSPQALKSTKELIRFQTEGHHEKSVFQKAADVISRARLSRDGQEGMKAFLEKIPPKW